VPPGADPQYGATLQRLDPHAKLRTLTEAEPSLDLVLPEVVESTRADGVVLPLTVEEFPDARARWGDRVIFSPTVGLSDPEVNERWAAVIALSQ
jgi:hypothetical protein